MHVSHTAKYLYFEYIQSLNSITYVVWWGFFLSLLKVNCMMTNNSNGTAMHAIWFSIFLNIRLFQMSIFLGAPSSACVFFSIFISFMLGAPFERVNNKHSLFSALHFITATVALGFYCLCFQFLFIYFIYIYRLRLCLVECRQYVPYNVSEYVSSISKTHTREQYIKPNHNKGRKMHRWI